MLCLLTIPAWADSPSLSAREWLERMSRAAHELDYEGTFVYLHDKQMMAMHFTHVADEQGEHERLVSLNGTGEVILNNNSMVSLLPGQPTTNARGLPRKSFPEALANGIGQLEKYYDFTLQGKRRVAGRLTQKITVKPKDNYRYGYRLWIDDASGLLLKADMLNESGVPLEQMMFTEIKLDSGGASSIGEPVATIADHAVAAEKTGIPLSARQEPLTDSSKVVGDREWHIQKMPDGFRMAEHNKYIMPANQMPVEHIVLTDGLASVSVFIEKLDSKDKFVGTSHRGAVNAYGRVSDGHQITLLGEVPMASVRLIGQSIERHSKP